MMKILAKVKQKMVEEKKMVLFNLCLIILLSSCNTDRNDEFENLIYYSNENMYNLLKEDIEEQVEYIKIKSSDFPPLKSESKNVIFLKNTIEVFIENQSKQLDLQELLKFRDSLNIHYDLKLKFIKNNDFGNDSIKKIVLRNDLLIINHMVNKNYISKHCNFVY